jgi:hypothetical protein
VFEFSQCPRKVTRQVTNSQAILRDNYNDDNNKNSNNSNSNNNSVHVYLLANSTAQRPITEEA